MQTVASPREIVVVGAGIVGCAIAYELARRGASVVVVDDRAPGMGATQASAGVLAPYIEAREGSPLLGLTVRSLDLFDDFIARIHSAPVQWRLILTVGQPGDPTDDATIPWPEDREHVDAGTLTLDEVESEAPGNCRDINFDPLVVPVGIAPSDDPLLSARSAVYSQSFTRARART